MDKKFGYMFRYPSLLPYKGLRGEIPLRYENIYLGLEIEMEGIQEVNRRILPPSFSYVEDGSLKVEGIEAVTVPIKFKFIEPELKRLFAALNPIFSHRTSIHVHMNARDMTLEELVKFIILYLLFEKSMYKFSGNRWNNNYCVPLYQNMDNVISLFKRIKNNQTPPYSWSKYTGINLNPLWGVEGASERIGTIEFRQMEGTKDINRIITWCNLITCLKFSAKQIKMEELLTDITNKNVYEFWSFIESIFKNWLKDIYSYDSFISDFNLCLSQVKYILFQSGYLTIIKEEQPTSLSNTINSSFLNTLAYSAGVVGNSSFSVRIPASPSTIYEGF